MTSASALLDPTSFVLADDLADPIGAGPLLVGSGLLVDATGSPVLGRFVRATRTLDRGGRPVVSVVLSTERGTVVRLLDPGAVVRPAGWLSVVRDGSTLGPSVVGPFASEEEADEVSALASDYPLPSVSTETREGRSLVGRATLVSELGEAVDLSAV